jgi:hypothetical protein
MLLEANGHTADAGCAVLGELVVVGSAEVVGVAVVGALVVAGAVSAEVLELELLPFELPQPMLTTPRTTTTVINRLTDVVMHRACGTARAPRQGPRSRFAP